MPDIKTRDVVDGAIKTVDRTALMGQRMKDAYVQTKRKAEHSVSSPQGSTEEYAADQITDTAETVAHESVHQMGYLGQKVIRGKHSKDARCQDGPVLQTIQSESIQENPPPSTDRTVTKDRRLTQNAPHGGTPPGEQTQRAHRNVIHDQQISAAKADLKKKRTEKPNAPSAVPATHPDSVSVNYTTEPALHNSYVSTAKSIKTIERAGEPIKQTAQSAGKVTLKTSERTIKTASSTVKTVEQVGITTIKTTRDAARATQETAVATARGIQRIRSAGKAAATTAKALAVTTAKAVRDLMAAVRALGSALAAGGWITVLVIVMIVVCFAGIMLASDEDDTEILPVSEEVKDYEPIIQRYAQEHGIGDYVLLIEAVMMQESGGRGTDPMQCSECHFNTLYPHSPGSITDPEYSINVGIQNLADCLQIARCESPVDMDAIKLALQGYNYGQGYITWAMSRYGEYTKANAVEFSINAAQAHGWSSYGDMNYVPHVLRYYPLGQIFYGPDTSQLIVEVARTQIGNVGGGPYWSWYGFTERVEWCACFVSWCADRCGYIDAGIIPKFAGCINGVNWFKERGQWAGNSIEPIPGMIIFFDWEGESDGGGLDGLPDHVGIVEKVENGRVYTIEGNTSDSCRERSYPLGHYEILGYGIPTY